MGKRKMETNGSGDEEGGSPKYAKTDYSEDNENDFQQRQQEDDDFQENQVEQNFENEEMNDDSQSSTSKYNKSNNNEDEDENNGDRENNAENNLPEDYDKPSEFEIELPPEKGKKKKKPTVPKPIKGAENAAANDMLKKLASLNKKDEVVEDTSITCKSIECCRLNFWCLKFFWNFYYFIIF